MNALATLWRRWSRRTEDRLDLPLGFVLVGGAVSVFLPFGIALLVQHVTIG